MRIRDGRMSEEIGDVPMKGGRLTSKEMEEDHL
jgi:hypothetical protein